MTPTWYPEDLTPAELWAAVVETDVAGQVEAATWPVQDIAPHIAALHNLAVDMARDYLGTYAGPVGSPTWPDSWLPEDDRRVWR